MEPRWSPNEPKSIQMELEREIKPLRIPFQSQLFDPFDCSWAAGHFDTVSGKKKVPKSALIPDKRVLSISKKVMR